MSKTIQLLGVTTAKILVAVIYQPLDKITVDVKEKQERIKKIKKKEELESKENLYKSKEQKIMIFWCIVQNSIVPPSQPQQHWQSLSIYELEKKGR